MSLIEGNYCSQEKLSSIALVKEIIQGKSFEECQFDGCSFIDCKFEKCRFLNCKFNECILSAINPLDSRFIQVKFTNCKVIGFDWTKAQKIDELDFNSCQINYSNFKLLKLQKIKMIKCEAKEVDFTEADLSGGDFNNTNFEKSRFFKTNLSAANFRGAKNYWIDVKNNTLEKAHFSLPEALALLNSLDIRLD